VVVKCFDDSDIRFLLALNKFIGELKIKVEEGTMLRFSLLGTCGAQAELNTCYMIDRVYKYDRGEIGSDGKYSTREDKVAASEQLIFSYSTLKRIKLATAFSANFLNHCKSPLKLPDFEVSCFDMETYDFTVVIYQNDVQLGFVVRVVSDNFQKTDRMSATFEQLDDSIFKAVKVTQDGMSKLFCTSSMCQLARKDYRTVTSMLISTLNFLKIPKKITIDGKTEMISYITEIQCREFWKQFFLQNYAMKVRDITDPRIPGMMQYLSVLKDFHCERTELLNEYIDYEDQAEAKEEEEDYDQYGLKEAERKCAANIKLAAAAIEKRLDDERIAKEAEEKRLEEERLAKEAEEKRLEEERLAKEAEEKRLEEERLAKEAEERRLEEERLAKEAEEKRLEEE